MTNEEIKTLLVDFYRNIDEDNCSMFDLNMKNAILDGEGNLKTWISEKTLGVALYSIFNAMKKTRETEEKRIRTEKLNELHSEDEFFGEVGYKFKGNPIKVTFTKLSSFETMYGTTFVWNMIDEEGHTFVWFASGSPIGMLMMKENEIKWNDDLTEEVRQNELTKISKLLNALNKNIPISFEIIGGSIKDHKEYTNRDGVTIKQTVVTRCKIDKWSV